MAEPILRIPIDDAAFKAYLEAFKRYQTQLGEQPDMWNDINERIIENVTVADALASAINRQIDNATRLGNVEERNAARKKKERNEEEAEQERATKWRKTALGHVQELSRASSTIMRGISNFATGSGGGGLFKGVEEIGKGLGGTLGGVVNLVGHALNANYEMNVAASDKGQFARGIGSSVGQMEGFQTSLGRYTDTNAGIDAVMNARGDPRQFVDFAKLGVNNYQDKNVDNPGLYAEVLKRQVELARRYTKGNVTQWQNVDILGGSAFGTRHEDINRLLKAPDLDAAISKSLGTKSALDKDGAIDKATKAANAQDALTVSLQDSALALNTKFDGALGNATDGLQKLADVVMKIVGLIPDVSLPSAGTMANLAINPIGTITGAIGGTVGSWLADKATKWWKGDKPDAHAGASLTNALNGQFAGQRDGGAFATSSAIGMGAASSVMGKGAKGRMAAIASALKAQGFSDTAALSAAAGVMAESRGDPTAIGPQTSHGKAFGIEQLMDDRQKRYFAMAGADHADPKSLQEQVKFLAWELKGGGGEKGGRGVMTATDFAQALHHYVFDFMRPQGANNKHLADAIHDMQRGAAALAKMGINIKVDSRTGAAIAVSANSVAKAG